MRSKLFFTLIAVLLGASAVLADDVRPPSAPNFTLGMALSGGGWTIGDCLYVATGPVVGQQSCGAANLTIGSTNVTGTAGLLYSNGSILQSLAATVGADPYWSTLPAPNTLVMAPDNGLILTKTGNYNSAALQLIDSNTTGGSGQIFEIYNQIGGTLDRVAYYGGGFSNVLFTLTSGHKTSSPPHSTILLPTEYEFMDAVWNDITGPGYMAEGGYGVPGELSFLGMDDAGYATIGLDSYNWKIVFGHQAPPGGGYGVFTGDTALGRGNQAALLQAGGQDVYSAVAQTFAAPSVPSAATLPGEPSAAGQNLLYFDYALVPIIPNSIQVGATVTDTTTAGAIPANTTVTAINYASQYFTLSNNITGAGVGATDNLVFSYPNASASNLTIAGGRGTGTGAGGSLCLGYAPAGSSGAAQNAWVCEGTINGSGLTLGVQGSLPGALTLANTASTYAVTLKGSNSATAGASYTLPPAPPGSNGYMLTATTAGVMSWVSPGSATLSIGSGISGSTNNALLCVSGTGTLSDTGCTNVITFPQTVASATSGGIAYFSGTTTMASSALLANGSLMIGGGAGGAPSSVTLAGDCTFSTPNITCTKTNGAAFGALATVTPAANVATVMANALQGSSTLGLIVGVNSGTNVSIGGGSTFTSSSNNVAIGLNSLGASSPGTGATAVGSGALQVATGGNSEAFGFAALNAVTSGYYNQGMGSYALANVTTGKKNIGIGYNVGHSIVAGSNNVLLGSNVDTGSDVNNVIAIGIGSGTIEIDFGLTTASVWTAHANFATTGAFVAGGAVPTLTTGACSGSSATGGATAGSFTAATCSGGTYILSGLPTAPHGYACGAWDETTPADTVLQTATTTTSATFKATTASGDSVVYHCIGF